MTIKTFHAKIVLFFLLTSIVTASATANQPLFERQQQMPIEPPFKYQHAYITEIYDEEVDITVSDFGNPYPAPVFPGDELYVSLVSPVPVNVYVTDLPGHAEYIMAKIGIQEGFDYHKNLSREEVTSWSFTVSANEMAFPHIIVDPISNYDVLQYGLPRLTIIRGSDYTDQDHQRAYDQYVNQIQAEINAVMSGMDYIYDDNWAESFQYY